MLRFAADENFNGNIVRGLLRRLPDLDIIRVQDTPLYRAPDTKVLAWAADERRILLTHDLTTVPALAFERISATSLDPFWNVCSRLKQCLHKSSCSVISIS